MAPVRIALFGNSFASRIQLPALRWAGRVESARHEVIGIAGHDPEKAAATAAEWGIPRSTGDWTELLELGPDLVVVTTPVDLHEPMVCASLEAGAAVLCEKPFALDASQAERMVAAGAAAAGGTWIDHQLRWNPGLRRMRQWIADGSLGDVRHASFEMLIAPPPGSPPRPWSWWYDASRGGGTLGALGSHLLDLARWELGELEVATCDLVSFLPERPDATGTMRPVTADEYAALSLRTRGGAVVDLRTSVATPGAHAFVVQVTGSERTARLVDGLELSVGPTGGDLEPEALAPLPSFEELDVPPRGIFARCLPLYLRDLLGAVAAGSQELDQAATFADGLAVQRLIDDARAAHAAAR